jgi:two-component system CheB/CheR fusion protein
MRQTRRPPVRRLTPAALTPPGPTLAEQAISLLDALSFGVAIVDRNYDIRMINVAARRLLGVHGAGLNDDLIHRVPSELSGPLRAAVDGAFAGRASAITFRLSSDVVADHDCDLAITCQPTQTEASGGPIDAVRIEIADITGLVRERDGLGRERTVLQAEVEALRKRVEVAVAEVRDLRSANESMAAEVGRLRAENEQLQLAHEEVQAAAEEIETLNEEQQATNEELETLNEELQATVEELNTTNDDLQARSVELQDLAVSLEEQRRSAEAERARLQAVLVAVPDAFALVGRHAVPLLTNPAYDRLFGAGSDAVVFEDESGRPLAREDDPRRRAARGDTFSLRCVGQWPDGTRRQLEVRASPIDAEEPEQGTGLLVIRELRDGR